MAVTNTLSYQLSNPPVSWCRGLALLACISLCAASELAPGASHQIIASSRVINNNGGLAPRNILGQIKLFLAIF